MSPPTSPARVDTPTTIARLSFPWLAATPAAPSAVAPMKGTPAHDAATATNRATYCHQVPATFTEARVCMVMEPWADAGGRLTSAIAPRRSRGGRGVRGARRRLLRGLGA